MAKRRENQTANNSLDQRDSTTAKSEDNRIVDPRNLTDSWGGGADKKTDPIRYEWKSKVLIADPSLHGDDINWMSQEGWELFQVYVVVESRPCMMGRSTESRTVALFRRQKHDEPGIS
jgi:hypothetical protein